MQWSPRAVIFDFDGVLVNSEPLHYRALSEVLRGEKIDLTEDEYYNELIGTDDKGSIRHVYARRRLPLDNKTLLRILAHKTEQMMDLIYRLRPAALPGADEFVRGLWRNYPLAICSGALRDEIEALLEGIGLRDCFPILTAAEDVTRGKPDPEGYLMTMARLSERMKTPLRPQDVLIIEDAPAVIERVRPLEFKVLGVATSHFIDKLGGANWAVRSLRREAVREVLPGLKIFEDEGDAAESG